MTETKTPKAGTEYVVLQLVDNKDATYYYVEINKVTANNDKQAITKVLGDEPSPGDYVAIPARSFKVRQVSSSTETRITVG